MPVPSVMPSPVAVFRTIYQVLGGWFLTVGLGSVYIAACVLSLGLARQPLGEVIMSTWGRAMLTMCGVKVRIHDPNHILSTQRPQILAFNHASLLDDYLMLAIAPRGGRPVVKKEVLRVPFAGWVCWLAGVITIDRKQRGRALAKLDEVARRFEKDRISALMAPEGTRSRTGELGIFRLGIFHLAQNAKAPIVPVVIHGARDLQPMGRLHTSPGTIRVTVLPPFEYESGDYGHTKKEADRLRETFAEALSQARIHGSSADAA